MRYHLTAGKYYIGDPCYVIRDNDKWAKVCERMEHNPALQTSVLGLDIFLARTQYGDGTYTDRQNNKYSVDSGTIGAVPIELCDPTQNITDLGHIFDFHDGLTIRYNEGKFEFFGRLPEDSPDAVVIDTSYEDDDVSNYGDEEEG